MFSKCVAQNFRLKLLSRYLRYTAAKVRVASRSGLANVSLGNGLPWEKLTNARIQHGTIRNFVAVVECLIRKTESGH